MSIYKGNSKIMGEFTVVNEEQVKEITREVIKEKKWYIKAISLESTTTSWQINNITVPEIIGAEEVRLYDETNNVWTATFTNVDGESLSMYFTNGFGATDGYMFTQHVTVNFKNGTITNVTTRDLNNNPPKFTRIAYYK